MVRYADDFVVFARTKLSCEQARQKLTVWLKTRGLELSEKKTGIVHIEQGFDFLGFNIRHYKTKSKRRGKVILCKPSKDSVKSFMKQMISCWKKGLSWKTERLISYLNPKIKGWCNYFRTGTSKKTFSFIDHWMFIRQKRYVTRRHRNKYWWWKKKHYWGRIQGRDDQWVFMNKRQEKGTYLWKLSWTPIKRHILVKSGASPDNANIREYWRTRQIRCSKYMMRKRSILWRKQRGLCPVCNDRLDNDEIIHMHHKHLQCQGGDDRINNLVLLHETCHRQVHSKQGQQLAEVRKLLEPYAE